MKTQKGITLIALIITIIVMLILVGVSVSVALNTGLFKAAQGAAKNTQRAAEAETALSNGTIKLEGQEGEIDIDDYIASLKGKEEITFEKQGAGDLTIGSEVTASNGETFYVIGFSSDNTIVNLLAKYNLNANGSAQDSTGAINPCAFCSGDAWNAANVADGDDLNNKESIKSETTSAVHIAGNYGAALGGTGRLILYDEVTALASAYPTILYGQYETGDYLNFWTGSGSPMFLSYVVGNPSGYEGTTWGEFPSYGSGDTDYNNCGFLGLRPVVEVPISSIN